MVVLLLFPSFRKTKTSKNHRNKRVGIFTRLKMILNQVTHQLRFMKLFSIVDGFRNNWQKTDWTCLFFQKVKKPTGLVKIFKSQISSERSKSDFNAQMGPFY